jgi:hypothetical protein
MTVPLPPARPSDLSEPQESFHHISEGGYAAPQTIPLPPQKPQDFVPPAPEQILQPGKIVPSPQDNEGLRTQVLTSHRILGKDLPPVADNRGCGMAAPLEIDAILLEDGSKVMMSPPVTLRASLASAFADWIRDDLSPAIAATGDRLARVEGVGGYECRGRNRISGAKLSEHAFGNALDLEAFVTERGKHLAIAAPGNSLPEDTQAFLALMKKTACLRFMTVLGPGSDAYHAQHLHIDLEERRHGTHLCQWTPPNLAIKAGTAGK